jgi:hypothetical protein
MERLTSRGIAYVKGKQIVLCNHEESDCNDSCMYGRCEWNRKALEKLKAYEDAEEQGLLLRLPVPEGTDVYELIKIVDYGEVGDKGEFKYYHRKTKFCRNMIEEFGETVFLTEGQAAQKIHNIEAEQELAKMEGGFC